MLFGLVSLLVVVFIIAVLLSLLVPAVLKSRETTRRVGCVNNLKQLAFAAANYQSANEAYPFGVGGGGPPGEGRVPRWSAHSQLLPFLEQGAVFHALNFSGVAWMADPVFGPPNASALRTTIATFLCPAYSDPGGDPYGLGHSNYRACAGTKPWNLAEDSPDGTGRNDGLFWYQSAVRLSSVTDGTSNTVAFSERCLGGPSGVGFLGDHYIVDASTAACVGAASWRSSRYAVPHEQSGQRWGDGALFYTRYNHVLPPNSPSCLLGGTTDYGSPVVVSASSRHAAGGVTVAHVDGSVRFLRSTIDPRHWQSLATIAGAEGGPQEGY